MDAKKLWTSSKQRLKGSFPKNMFDIYFNEESIPIMIKDNVFYLRGNVQTKEFFEVQRKEQLLKTFQELAANITDIKVITDADKDTDILDTTETNKKNADMNESEKLINMANSIANAKLNPKYTFNTFVIGSSNNYAVASCLRVAEYDEPSNDNPLFLYGGVGLGKTHLMHAIGHKILERDPSKKVLYVSSETFTNELITAIRNSKNEEFRNKYRNVDVFMIDDVQFIAGKDRIQEELFHTFNDIYNAGKRIILSSDKPPKEIKDLEERLSSRFAMGAMADIQPPDYATRMAVIQTKAENDNFQLPIEVAEYIADNVQSNIREIEGALNRVISYTMLSKKELTVDTAREALKDIIVSYNTKELNILRIKEMVADAYNVSVDDINSKKRTKTIAFPRQVAMYLARNLLDTSLPSIGEEFGGRDHTTVMHAIKKIEDEIEKSEMTKVKIEKIMSDLKS